MNDIEKILFNMLDILRPKDSKEFNNPYEFALYLLEETQPKNEYEEEKIKELAFSELEEAYKVLTIIYPEEEK